jgi:hypothetical protein
MEQMCSCVGPVGSKPEGLGTFKRALVAVRSSKSDLQSHTLMCQGGRLAPFLALLSPSPLQNCFIGASDMRLIDCIGKGAEGTVRRRAGRKLGQGAGVAA